MKFFLFVFAFVLLQACNVKEGIKETGDVIQRGADNVVEAVKDSPDDVSEASNKAEKDIKD